jgi:hypothetical protein
MNELVVCRVFAAVVAYIGPKVLWRGGLLFIRVPVTKFLEANSVIIPPTGNQSIN